MSIQLACSGRAVVLGLVGSAIAAGWGPSARGADFPLNLRQINRNTITQMRRLPAEDGAMTPFAQTSTFNKSVTLGIAYERVQGGDHSVTTPFLFDYTPPDNGSWDIQFGGDGYTRSVSGGDRNTGFADVYGAVSYRFALDKRWALQPVFTLTLPTHGQVGSSRASQDGALILFFKANDQWNLSGGGIVSRGGESTPDTSRYTKIAFGQGTYSWSDDTKAFLKLQRAYKGGAGGKTALTAEFDFPVSPRFAGTLAAAHGLTAGKRTNSIEFDLAYAF